MEIKPAQLEALEQAYDSGQITANEIPASEIPNAGFGALRYEFEINQNFQGADAVPQDVLSDALEALAEDVNARFMPGETEDTNFARGTAPRGT
ncbi:MAG: hypothetical protein AAF219_08775 [Myxococcota bacterium]